MITDQIEPDDGMETAHREWDTDGGSQSYLSAFWMLVRELPVTEPHVSDQPEHGDAKSREETP